MSKQASNTPFLLLGGVALLGVCFLCLSVLLVAGYQIIQPFRPVTAPSVVTFPTAVPFTGHLITPGRPIITEQPPDLRAQFQDNCRRSGGSPVFRSDGTLACEFATPVTPLPPTSTPNPTIAVPPPTPTRPPVREWFQLVNRHSQKCLTAEPGDDHIVQQPCYLNQDSQLWKLPESLYATTYLTPLQARNGLCAGFRPGHAEVVASSCANALVWKIDPISTSWAGVPYPLNFPHGHAIVSPIENGPYYLIKYGDQCLDLDSWDHSDGAAIIHYDCQPHTENMDNQLWAKH